MRLPGAAARGSGAARRTAPRAAASRRSPMCSAGMPQGEVSQGSTRPPSRTSTRPTCGRGEQRRHGRADPARADHPHSGGPAVPYPRRRPAGPGVDHGERRQVGPEPVEGGCAMPYRVGQFGVGSRIVQYAALREQSEQPPGLRRFEPEGLGLAGQRAQAPGAVQQVEEAGRGSVHRVQYDGMGRIHPELDAFAISPAPAHGGLEHGTHGHPRGIRSVRFVRQVQNARRGRQSQKVIHRL